MAAGDLITLDKQYEYGGLLIGSMTMYQVESWTGLFEMVADSSDLKRGDRDGAVPGLDLINSRVMNGKINLICETGPAATHAALLDFQHAFRPRMYNEIPFVYKLPGIAKRFVNARCRRSAAPSDFELAYGHGIINCQLVATDVRHYDLQASTGSVTIANGATTNSGVIVSAGKQPTEAVITIPGPANNVIVTVSGQTTDLDYNYNGNAIKTTCTLSALDTMVIDLVNKVIKINGVTRHDVRNNDSQWFSLLPGNNTITYSRSTNGAASTASLSWHDAYLY